MRNLGGPYRRRPVVNLCSCRWRATTGAGLFVSGEDGSQFGGERLALAKGAKGSNDPRPVGATCLMRPVVATCLMRASNSALPAVLFSANKHVAPIPVLRRKPPETATPLTYSHRARRRLYPILAGAPCSERKEGEE